MKLKQRPVILVFLLLLLGSHTGIGQIKSFSYKQVYERGTPKLTRALPDLEGWLDDQHYAVLKADEDNREDPGILYKVNAESGDETILADFRQLNQHLPDGFEIDIDDAHTEDFSAFVISKENDLYYLDIKGHDFRQLTSNPGEEKNPSASAII